MTVAYGHIPPKLDDNDNSKQTSHNRRLSEKLIARLDRVKKFSA